MLLLCVYIYREEEEEEEVKRLRRRPLSMIMRTSMSSLLCLSLFLSLKRALSKLFHRVVVLNKSAVF